MGFLESVETARAFLERNRRVSLSALPREFDLDDDVFQALIEELVEVQRVALRDGPTLAWAGAAPATPSESATHERAPRDYTPRHLAEKILQSKSALEGYFELRDLGPFAIKGVSEPVPTFELRGVGPLRSRFDVSRARGLSRFVGRDAEMALLDRALQAVASGQFRIVGIVGEAGVGKSRLVHEFLERNRARFPSNKGQCAPHTQSIPLLPVIEAFRDAIGITAADDAETCRVKITGFLLRTEASLAGDVPFVLDFLGVRDPAQPGPELEPRHALLDIRCGAFERANRRIDRFLERAEWYKDRFGLVEGLFMRGACLVATGPYDQAIGRADCTTCARPSACTPKWARPGTRSASPGSWARERLDAPGRRGRPQGRITSLPKKRRSSRSMQA